MFCLQFIIFFLPADVQCKEVLLMHFLPPHSETRFNEYYGVYELQEDFFCQGPFSYMHTSENYNMWRDFSSFDILSGAVDKVWQVTADPCDTNGGGKCYEFDFILTIMKLSVR